MADMKANVVITLIDRVTGPARQVNRSLSGVVSLSDKFNRMRASTAAVGAGIAKVSSEAAALGGKLLLLGGAGAWLFKDQFIDVAAEFERLTTVLETIEGSSAAAGKAMSWVSDFATKTPYELNEVTKAFVKLRTLGIDPMDGTLLTLGDTSSAMAKPLDQVVEAIADASTGEFERLKELGITSETKGNKTRFNYTDNKNQQQHKDVNNNDPAAIRKALLAIWSERFAGAMEKHSKGWDGMMSNLSDHWKRFRLMVMGEGGVFAFLEENLKGLLSTLDRMAASGALKALAVEIGGNLKNALINAWEAAQGLWSVLKPMGEAIAWVAEKVGGFKVLGAALGIALGGKLLLSIASLAGSLLSLGSGAAGLASSMAGVVGQTSLGIGALTKFSAALPAIVNNVAGVGTALGTGVAIGTVVNEGINMIDEAYGTKIGLTIGESVAKVLASFGFEDARRAVEGDYSGPRPSAQPQKSEMVIRVESKDVKVRSVSTKGFGDDLKIMMGHRGPT